jgi:multiple sugar transport system substrate-binding protein
MSQFMTTLAALKSHGMYGIAVQPQPGNWLPFAASAYGGVQPASASGKLAIDNPNIINTLNWYGSLVNKYHYSPVVPGSALSNVNYALDLFTSGNVAMYVGGPWNMPTGKAASGFPKYGIVSMPSSNGQVPLSVTAGSGFGITKNCAHPKQAFEALSVLIGATAQKETGQSGWGYPALNSAQEAYYGYVEPGAKQTLGYLAQNEKPRLVSSNWATVSNALAQQVIEVANSGTSASQVLQSVQAQYAG